MRRHGPLTIVIKILEAINVNVGVLGSQGQSYFFIELIHLVELEYIEGLTFRH